MARVDVATMLVGGSKLFRQGLKRLLAQSHYVVEVECDDLFAASALVKTRRPRLMIVVGALDDESSLAAVRKAAPRIRVAVLAHTLNLEEFYAAMQAGADAYLLDGISIEALSQALDLAMVGEKVLPSKLVGDILSGRLLPVADSSELAKVLTRLSKREVQVLNCLISGEPNRAIAAKLSISEATVKVALKGLLRKLGVANRTQAAIWALDHGFGISSAADGPSARDPDDR